MSAQAIKEKLQGELDELETELRIHLPKEIKRALEFGDLRENSEYRAALDRQNVVKARIVELRQRISEIASIDPNKVPRDKASYGSTLVLYDAEKNEEVTYRLVTPEESDPAQGELRLTMDRKAPQNSIAQGKIQLQALDLRGSPAGKCRSSA